MRVRGLGVFVVLLGSALASGCPSSDQSGSDGSMTAGDASVDALVDQCVANVDNERMVECQGAANQCLYAALRPLCASGRTEYITKAFQCLIQDGHACPTPSDPSDAQSCINDDIAQFATDADRALGAAICMCEGSAQESGCENSLPQQTMATLMFLNGSDTAAFTDCIHTMGCSALRQCGSATALGPALSCGG
jgi:hypothetical protein